jgi:hypothetical protein
VVGAALCVGLLLPAPTATADEGIGAVCTFTAVVRHRPGFLLTTPTEGEFFAAEGASVACLGRFGGEELSPEPGALSVHGAYKGNCLGATGRGRIEIETRTVAGDPLVLQGPFKLTRSGPVVQASGQLDKAPFEFKSVAGPDPGHPEENCMTKPLDHVAAAGTITINGSGGGSQSRRAGDGNRTRVPAGKLSGGLS